MSEITFYSSYLHTFCNTGNEMLEAIDKIISGEIVWFDDSTL